MLPSAIMTILTTSIMWCPYKELCAIRDNTSLCDIADINDIVVLINDICNNRIDDVRYLVLVMYLSPFSVYMHDICI